MAPHFSELCVDAADGTIRCLLADPDRLSTRPALLLNFATDRANTLQQTPYDIPSQMFLAAGHRVASFDLPCHGERGVAGRPGGIAGFIALWAEGRDVFSQFVGDGRAVIDALINDGRATPGRIFVCGTSRGAYFALRLMAGDERIEAAAAFNPVTDWRAIREFADLRDQPEIADLALTGSVDALAGRAVWAAIGNRDMRVGTDCCLQFVQAIVAAESAKGCETSHVVLHVVPEDGHKLSDDWRRRGGEHLLSIAKG